MNKFKRFIDYTVSILNALSIIIFSLMVIFGFAEVLFRYVLERSLTFSSELITYLFVWLIALGSAVVLRKNSHAALEILVNKLPDLVKSIVIILGILIVSSFLLILIIKGTELILGMNGQTSPVIGIPMAYAYAAIPVGSLFMLLYSLEALLIQIISFKKAVK